MITEENARRIAREVLAGVIDICIALIIILFIGWFVVSGVRNLMGWGVDDCDQSAWTRCNMTVLTDYKTGVEYLSDSKGGLVKRETK